MPIGQQMGSLKALKKSLAKGGGNAWIKYIPKNDSMTVRFIEEPENWINYTEHYDQTIRKSYPCNGEQSCPGCQTSERKMSRYLANAVDLSNDRVIPLQMPKDLANRLVVKYEKWGTLIDRDIELSRSGDGLDTVYDLDADAPSKRNLQKYTALDLMQVLEDAWNDVFGAASDEDDDEDAAPVKRPKAGDRIKRAKKRSAAAAAIDDDDEVDEDEDEKPKPRQKPAEKVAAKKAAKAKAPEPEFEPDEDEDDEDDEDDEGYDEDDEGYDEQTLRAMPLGALRAVARDFGVNPKGMDEDEIIEAILDAGEPVDDNEPPY